MKKMNKTTALLLFLCCTTFGSSLIVHSKTINQNNVSNTFTKDTVSKNKNLINNNSTIYRINDVFNSEIAPSNTWFSKILFPGYEDEIDRINNESIIWNNTPFILKRNTKEAVFLPLNRINYSTFSNRDDLSKIKYTFELNGPGTIDWDNVTLFREADYYQFPVNNITLTQESQNVYTYEIDISQFAQTVNYEDLFIFGFKVANLDYDNETSLSFKAELFSKSDPTPINSTYNINGISFAQENLQLDIPKEKRLCVGDTPPDYTNEVSSSLDFQSPWWEFDLPGKTSDITIDSSQVNYNIPGTYQVNYSVTSETEETTVKKDLDVIVIDNSITINYVDENGDILETKTISYQPKGTTFSQKSPEFDGFYLKNPSDDTISGTFNCDTQTFTVTYEKAPPVQNGQVTTLFVDENGQSISTPIIVTGIIGEYYQTYPIDIEGYTLISVPSNEQGQFTNDNITVTYIYKKNDVSPPISNYGQITTLFMDENGNSISKPIIEFGLVGNSYQTNPIDIDGYTLLSVPSNESGQFINGNITVTYIYKPIGVTPPSIEYGQVTTFFVDESGKYIAKPLAETGVVGENYQTYPIEIDGYTLTSVPENESGQFINGNISVTYVYKKDIVTPPVVEYGQVTTFFVDRNGKSIANSIVQNGVVGDTYQTVSIEIDGYKLVSTPNNEQGQFIKGNIDVTYVYEWISIDEDTDESNNDTITDDDFNTVINNNDTVNDNNKNDSANKSITNLEKNKTNKTLPKTDEKEQIEFIILGLIMSSLTSLVTIVRRK